MTKNGNVDEQVESLKREYARLAHAVQSGVAMEIQLGSKSATPKHLRVGLNLALVQHAAMAELLIEKGWITRREYWSALVETTRVEVERYQDRLRKALDANINLL